MAMIIYHYFYFGKVLFPNISPVISLICPPFPNILKVCGTYPQKQPNEEKRRTQDVVSGAFIAPKIFDFST
jgi:hypothetical protein